MADVILVTGPAGAGKTAAAELWAAGRSHSTAHVSIDDVRALLKTGYVNPEDGWTAEAERQLDLARKIVGDMARRYAKSGIQLVVDDAVFPEWEAAGEARWRAALGDLTCSVIVLLPSFEAVCERNRVRVARRRLRRETLRTIYDDMLPWRDTDAIVIDNTDLSVPETAAAIERALAGA